MILHQIREIDKEPGMDRYNFWRRLTDKELEILYTYPALRAWCDFVIAWEKKVGVNLAY